MNSAATWSAGRVLAALAPIAAACPGRVFRRSRSPRSKGSGPSRSSPLSTRNEDKEARERAIFTECAGIAGLRVREGSVASRPPPEPDILCELVGEGLVAFELVEIVDPDLAESVSVAVRRNQDARGVWVGDPTLERISEKIQGRSYSTPYPMELLAWAGRLTTPPSVWHPTYEQDLRALQLGSFRRLWVVNFGMRPDERGVWFVNPPPTE